MVSRLYEQIKADIINQSLKPGQKLPERVLADKYEVSRTPIRQVLQQLAAVGLVQFIPYKGAIVKNITLDEYRDIFQVRMILEGFATELCCKSSRRIEIISKLEDVMSQATQAINFKDFKEYSALDEEFHQIILIESDNMELKGIVEDVNQKAYVARLRFLALPGQVEKSIKDHNEIIACMKSGDAKLARKKAEEHVDDSINRYYEYLQVEKMLLGTINVDDI